MEIQAKGDDYYDNNNELFDRAEEIDHDTGLNGRLSGFGILLLWLQDACESFSFVDDAKSSLLTGNTRLSIGRYLFLCYRIKEIFEMKCSSIDRQIRIRKGYDSFSCSNFTQTSFKYRSSPRAVQRANRCSIPIRYRVIYRMQSIHNIFISHISL